MKKAYRDNVEKEQARMRERETERIITRQEAYQSARRVLENLKPQHVWVVVVCDDDDETVDHIVGPFWSETEAMIWARVNLLTPAIYSYIREMESA